MLDEPPVYGDASEPGLRAEDDVSVGAQLRNPFLITLGVLALLFVGVGALLFTRSYEAMGSATSFSSQADFFALEAAMTAGPVFVVFGAAIAAGILFVLGVRWRPRR